MRQTGIFRFWRHCRAVLGAVLVVALLGGSGGALRATPPSHAASPFVGPLKYYIAMGDSLADGHQHGGGNNDNFGYDYWFTQYTGQTDINLGCGGETSYEVIDYHGCPIPAPGQQAQCHPQVSGQLCYYDPNTQQCSGADQNNLLTQIDAVVCYLKLYPGQVSPMWTASRRWIPRTG